MKIRYKFFRETDGKIKSSSGDCVWTIGKTKKYKGKLGMCQVGFRCSKDVWRAFSFVQGEVLADVECSGKSKIQDDKEVYSEMKILRAWRWTKKDSVALSIFAAELCLENFEKAYPKDKRPREAIAAAKRWLENPTKENESVAGSAARSAARSAELAESVMESAAESAAKSAESAAWSVMMGSAAESVRSAAWSAVAGSARLGVIKKISKWMSGRIKVLEEIR